MTTKQSENDDRHFHARALLLAGVPHKTVAEETGLSLATLSRIARTDWEPPPAAPDLSPTPNERRKASRCPTCGQMLYRFPCLACAIELGLDLTDQVSSSPIIAPEMSPPGCP